MPQSSLQPTLGTGANAANTQYCSINERAKAQFTEVDELFQEQMGRLKHRDMGIPSSKHGAYEKVIKTHSNTIL